MIWFRHWAKRAQFRLPMGSLGFFIYLTLPADYGPGLDSASNRHRKEEFLLRCKGGRCVGLTILPPSCAHFLENVGTSSSWAQGPVHARMDIA